MPALPPVTDVLKASLIWTDGSDTDTQTGFFLRYSGGPPSNSDAVGFAGNIITAAAPFLAALDESSHLTGCRVTDLASPEGGDGLATVSDVGTRSGEPNAASICVLLNYQIARRYRGGKPRSYFPFGVAADLTTKQTWSGGLVDVVGGAFGDFIDAVIGTNHGTTTITDHVNVSYYDGFTVVTNPITHRARNVPTLRSTPAVDVITDQTVSVTVASQRRRNRPR